MEDSEVDVRHVNFAHMRHAGRFWAHGRQLDETLKVAVQVIGMNEIARREGCRMR